MGLPLSLRIVFSPTLNYGKEGGGDSKFDGLCSRHLTLQRVLALVDPLATRVFSR